MTWPRAAAANASAIRRRLRVQLPERSGGLNLQRLGATVTKANQFGLNRRRKALAATAFVDQQIVQHTSGQRCIAPTQREAIGDAGIALEKVLWRESGRQLACPRDGKRRQLPILRATGGAKSDGIRFDRDMARTCGIAGRCRRGRICSQQLGRNQHDRRLLGLTAALTERALVKSVRSTFDPNTSSRSLPCPAFRRTSSTTLGICI